MAVISTGLWNTKISGIVNVEDIRQAVYRRLPKVVFDYLDGAEAETTLRENCCAFQDVLFRPRQVVTFDKCDFRTRVLGTEILIAGDACPSWLH